VPVGTWAELHEVYLRAEQLGVMRDALEADVGGSIADLYCDALLLSLTDPYRLGRVKPSACCSCCGDSAASPPRAIAPATKPGGHFIVPCNTDKPPKPSIGKMDDTGGEDWRLLDANPVVEQLFARRDAAARGRPGRPRRSRS
jgi:hypothetical protein